MKFYREIKKLLLPGLFLFFSINFFGQETNSHVSGIVKSEKNEILQNATVIAIHEPTKNTYLTQTNSKGYFYFFNIKPGGPYSIVISHTGFKSLSRSDLFLNYSSSNFYSYLQGNEFSEFILNEKNDTLKQVIVTAKKQAEPKFGTETNLDDHLIVSLPSISRNLQDHVRLVPQSKVNGEGMISLAGQNNKFNAFFIDGSNNNDILGLAVSGINGGQTGSPPISIEAIEEIKVSLSPFDVQYGNFTGGSINAITRSGSNQFKSSAWYYFRNEKMAGKSPVPVEKPGSPGVYERTRLTHFFNQTAGVWASGPLTKNKMFYFLLVEKQHDLQPQPYNFSEYKGISTQQQINALADTIQTRYGYDPGSFLEAENKLDATRFIIKLDWNPSLKNKLTLSYRYNNADRITPQVQSGGTVIRFSNNRFRISSKINSVSFEWKKYFKGSANNRLLITYNNELTDRKIIGQPFPVVFINDGPATIGFGSNGTGHLNLFTASEFNLQNIFRFTKSKHAFSAGIDLNHSKLNDIALGSYYGQYRYKNMNDFISNAFASRYLRTTSLVDEPVDDNTKAAATFNSLRTGTFINDEVQLNTNLRLTAGIRIDVNSLPLKYKEDAFFNTVARPEIEKYYSLEGAESGRLMNPHWQLSPRFGLNYKMPDEKITIRGGAGVFTGHIINLWASEIYNVNSYNIDITPYGLPFIPDPFSQPDLQSLGLYPDSTKGAISLVTRNYKYPTVFRTSLSVDKKLKNNWTLTTEIIFTKNIYENKYTNGNLLPPSRLTPLPDSRNIYSLNTTPERLSMPGGNPYNEIILLGNNKAKTGFSYSLTAIINKSVNDKLLINVAYTYGNSLALYEPVGIANGNGGQWAQAETVNGKNTASRSVSDFDLGHRIYAALTKKINYGNWSTMITLFYNGQSGSPFSYVYNGSMINDNGSSMSNFDLIYIPTKADIDNMIFISNTVNGVTYTIQEQKQLLNNFIESDNYLSKHRGQFAERNGARLPFTHTIDLRVHQDLRIKIKKKETRISIIYDVFNFTNMLNKNWGRTYFLTQDNFPLIQFAGFANTTTLGPQYQFTPFSGKPWSVQNSTAPGTSARWISQLGVKIYFN